MPSETVSKTKGSTAAEAPEGKKERKTLTNWRMFGEGNFMPIQIKCEGYSPRHPSDMSCHSNLKITSEAVTRHMDPAHGGGWFLVKFRISDGKVSPLWEQLEDAGVELQEFYCPHCREAVQMTPRAVVKHLQPHAGATRINPYPQTLAMTLGYKRADVDEYDGLYEKEDGGF